jgi:hypothetical protein
MMFSRYHPLFSISIPLSLAVVIPKKNSHLKKHSFSNILLSTRTKYLPEKIF